MSESYFVKCEDCGRRLPGPARTCDVCGGKMTRSAEESYYTPEGIIKKRHYRDSARKTPDGDVKPVKPVKPAMKDNRKSASKVTSTLGSIAGIIVFLIVISMIFFGSMLEDNSYDDYDEGDYETIYVDESVSGDGYTLTLDQIDDEIDVDLYAYATIDVSGGKDIEMGIDSMALMFDGKMDGNLQYIFVNDTRYDTIQSVYSEKDKVVLESGKEYTVELCYDSVSGWSELTLIHNFSGKLADRDTSTDITVY